MFYEVEYNGTSCSKNSVGIWFQYVSRYHSVNILEFFCHLEFT